MPKRSLLALGAATATLAGTLVLPATVDAAAADAAAAGPSVPPVASLHRRAPRWAKRLMARDGALVPDTQPVAFYWGLKRRDAHAADVLEQISKPGSRQYRRFRTPARVAHDFGATRATVTAVQRYLASVGLHSELDPSRLVLRVAGKAGRFRQAFGVPILTGVADGYRIYAPAGDPVLPERIRGLVPDPIWERSTQLPAGRTGSAGRRAGLHGRDLPPPTNQGTMIGSCARLRSTPFSAYTMTVAQAARAYRMKALQGIRDRSIGGSQPLMGILAEGVGFSDRYLRQTRQCLGVSGTAVRIKTPGIRRPLASDAGEGDLDVQMAIAGLVGRSVVPVFESGPFDDGSIQAPLTVLNDSRRPTVLSISYGQCEPESEPNTMRLSDSIFLRLGLVGTSVLAAAGDSGSSDCVTDGEGPTLPSVDYPGSSPWVTSVGGTRMVLRPNNTRLAEYTWNDTEFAPFGGAGGGGVSARATRPWWQPIAKTGQTQRAVPDIAAHASNFPGFPIIGRGQPDVFALPVGGTSAATPLTAAGIALINERLRRLGEPPLGFINPWLYRMPAGIIYDITEGNNDLFGVGCCTAGVGYDLATGLGSPNFAGMLGTVRRARGR